jgi:hypothetical protein
MDIFRMKVRTAFNLVLLHTFYPRAFHVVFVHISETRRLSSS